MVPPTPDVLAARVASETNQFTGLSGIRPAPPHGRTPEEVADGVRPPPEGVQFTEDPTLTEPIDPVAFQETMGGVHRTFPTMSQAPAHPPSGENVPGQVTDNVPGTGGPGG